MNVYLKIFKASELCTLCTHYLMNARSYVSEASFRLQRSRTEIFHGGGKPGKAGLIIIVG